MHPVSPVLKSGNHSETVIAEHQDEYGNLPSIPLKDGSLLSRWELTDEEVQEVVKNKSIYLHIHAFGKPVQPVNIYAIAPQIIYPEQN